MLPLLLLSSPLWADEPGRTHVIAVGSEGEGPSYDASLGALEMLLESPRGQMVAYMACPQEGCGTDAPPWFELSDWSEAVDVFARKVGVSRKPLGEQLGGVDMARTSSIADPAERAACTAQELVGGSTRVFLYVDPSAEGDRLSLRWFRYAIEASPTLQASGRLDITYAAEGDGAGQVKLAYEEDDPAQVGAPAGCGQIAPITTPPRERWTREQVRLGSGLGLVAAGGAAIGVTARMYALDPSVVSEPSGTPKWARPAVLVNSLGWVGVGAGASLALWGALGQTDVLGGASLSIQPGMLTLSGTWP